MTNTRKSAIAMFALVGALSLSAGAEAKTSAKAGAVCTKANAKAGTTSKPLVCAKTKKGLRWTAVAAKKATNASDTTISQKASDTTISHNAADTTIKKK